MVLATHAIVGATLAEFVPSHPVLAFCIGFTSHFLLDTIPHWDYTLASSKKDESNPLSVDMVYGTAFIGDMVKILFDITLGIFASAFILQFLFHSEMNSVLLAGAIGGMLPDFLQFAYMKWRREPLVSLQKFHQWIHSERKLKEYAAAGISLQILLVAVIILSLRLLI